MEKETNKMLSQIEVGNVKENDYGTLMTAAFEIISNALIIEKPIIAENGFVILKWITKKDPSFYDEAKIWLSSLKEKFNDDIKLCFIDTLIKDLKSIDIGLPVFEKEVQDWINQSE